MASKIELDQFHWLEALDRTQIQMINVDLHLLQHPVLKVNPEIRKHIEIAAEQLFEAYQKLGKEAVDLNK